MHQRCGAWATTSRSVAALTFNSAAGACAGSFAGNMTSGQKLVAIKIFHTAVWVFFNVVIFYLLYAVVADRIDRWAWICLALIAAECVVLLIFKMACPLTLVARRYSSSREPDFDIYLPRWLAKYNKLIYGTVVVVILIGLVLRLVGR